LKGYGCGCPLQIDALSFEHPKLTTFLHSID
jgi:hypothetical protein